MRIPALALFVLVLASATSAQENIVPGPIDTQIPTDDATVSIMRKPRLLTISENTVDLFAQAAVRDAYKEIVARARKTCQSCMEPDYLKTSVKLDSTTQSTAPLLDQVKTSGICADCSTMTEAIKTLLLASKQYTADIDELNKLLKERDRTISALQLSLSNLTKKVNDVEAKLRQLEKVKQ